MNESGKKQLEIGIIVIFLVFGAFKLWSSKASSGKSARLPKTEQISAFNLDEAKRKIEDLDAGTKEEKEFLIERARDMFQKPAGVYELERKASGIKAAETKTPTAAALNLILEGTMWGGDKNMAIISGRVVCEGDIIENAKVLKIISNKVVISLNGSEIELKR